VRPIERTVDYGDQQSDSIPMQKIVVLNPKGGSGKSTIATSLASYFATQGLSPTLMDMDAQGSSMRWLSKRTAEFAPIHGIAAYERNSRVTRSFALRIPQGCERLVVDTAAALEAQSMPEITRDAHAVLVPVLPSDIDIHAAAKCITDLLLVAKIPREEQRIGVIANRVKKNTVMYRSLMRFLGTLEIPIVTTLRDSQNYVRAAEGGVGIFEMKPHLVREDWEQWLPLIGWLGQKTGGSVAIAAPTINVQSAAPSIPVAPTAIPVPRQPMIPRHAGQASQSTGTTGRYPVLEETAPKESSMKTSLPDFLRFVGGEHKD
jgi:chromosome partitioning protein